MELLIIIIVLIGLLPAFIAQGKGRSFVAWWVYGSLLFIVALPHSLLLKRDPAALEQQQLADGNVKKCPFCAEFIKRETNVCRFCGRDLPTGTVGERYSQGVVGQEPGYNSPAIETGWVLSLLPIFARQFGRGYSAVRRALRRLAR